MSQENITTASAKLRFELKRESPLDLSVKTVCRSADSTDDRLHPFGHDIPKVNFKPDFNACRGSSTSLPGATQPPQSVVIVSCQQQHPTYHQLPPQLTLPPPSSLPTTVMSPQLQQQPPQSTSSSALSVPVVQHHQKVPPVLPTADDTWRAVIDRQIEQKFSLYTKKQQQYPHVQHSSQLQPHQQQPHQQHPHQQHPHQQHPHQQHPHQQHPPQQHPHQQHPQQQPAQPLPLPTIIVPAQQQQQQQQQGPTQADKRVLEILKQNIEARDQSSRPQIAEAPSTPAMVFSTPIRKEPSTTPLKKTDYYMTERTAVTPFPKKIDYYMDRTYSNVPRIRTKAERKQVSAEGSSSGMRMSSPMAAATAISPHPFLPSNNSVPQTKQDQKDQIPLTQTEVVTDLKHDIKREPSPIKNPDLCLLNKEDTEKDEDEEFWMNTCNSFVVQLAETQEKKKVKTLVKKKLPKEQLPQPPKRKYTKRIKIEQVSEIDRDNKIPDLKEDTLKPTEEIKFEKSSLQEKVVCEDKPLKSETLDMDKENKIKVVESQKAQKVDDIKEKEDNEEESDKVKPKRKRIMKLKFKKPIVITKVKKMKKEEKKELKTKKEIKEMKKEEKKELKKGEKKETIKKEPLVQKSEKKELAAVAKEEKKGLKKEEKRDLKKDQQPDNKKDLNYKKESKKAEAIRKKVAAEKENVTKNNENTRRSAAINPRQSLRRKNSLKDYTFAFDELLDDAFAHFETDKIPVKRRRKCASPSPSPAPAVVAAVAAQVAAIIKKPKEKVNETIRMRLRSRNRPLLAKQEPQKATKKKGNVKNKNIPKRRRKKSLGEKSAHSSDGTTVVTDWKDELYKFKRSLRLPSKLISVVSPPSAVGPDQVSLTSIMNIQPPHKSAKEPKVTKSVTQLQATVVGTTSKNCKAKRLGHIFGRRDVFKGRHLMKREKIVSAEKLMQRNRRKKRQQEDVEKKSGCAGEKASVALHEDEEVLAEEEEEEEDEEDEDEEVNDDEKPPARILFKRKFMRKKFRSGFDYIKKKKKKEPASEKKPAVVVTAASVPPPKCEPRYVSEIQAEIKGWIVNKGHGETVLHRAARLGVKDVVGYCIEKLEYAPSVADNAGYTPLHEACSQGHYHIAKLLLQFGADVSASAQGGIRPLHEAVENGDVHLVRLLLSYGADPRLATYSGQSPLSLASDRQTRILLEHHVSDIQGYGSASVWNFEDIALNRLNHEPEDVDRLLWCSPPSALSLPADDNLSFEFEFAEHSLPDVYKMCVDDGDDDDDDSKSDDWVLFTDVSTALSIKTADALVKLLNDENSVKAVPADRFNERAVPRNVLGRQPVTTPANKPSTAINRSSTAANKPNKPSATAAEQPHVKDNTGVTDNTDATTESASSAAVSEQILLVRYDRKLKQLLGVDAYTLS